MDKIKILRFINKLMMGTLNERIMLEKLFRTKEIYNYLEVPEVMFKK